MAKSVMRAPLAGHCDERVRMKSLAWIVLMLLTAPMGAGGVEGIFQQDLPGSSEAPTRKLVKVPERVATLLRPLLDLREDDTKACTPPTKCIDGDAYRRKIERSRTFGSLLYALTKRKGPDSDEALVVLMCFYIGESQEEADEVIRRGRRMLPYLHKYRHAIPTIPDREYPNSMLRNGSTGNESIEGAISAIKRGLRGTWDNPDG